MTAQTTTQRTAKHRLAVKERMDRYRRALEMIAQGSALGAAMVAKAALMEPDSSNGAEKRS